MGKRLTLEEVKAFIESFEGYKLLSTEYIDNSTKLLIECPLGHQFEKIFGNFQQGQRCTVCAKDNRGKKKRLSYNVVKNKFESEGYKLLSNEYINAHIPMTVECPVGHVYKVDYANFYSGKRCPECFKIYLSKALSLDYEEVKEYIESFGFKLLSKVYEGNKIPLTIQCKNGHIFERCFNNFKHETNLCPICEGRQHQLTYNYVKEYIESFNYKLHSTEYINNSVLLKVECDRGHIYEVPFSNFQAGHRCKICMYEINAQKFKLDGEFVYNEFLNMGYIPMFDYDDYKKNNNNLPFICQKHIDKDIQYTSYSQIKRGCECCKYCYSESRSGENHPFWKGGISHIRNYLWSCEFMKQWRKSSMKENQYKCILSGESFQNVHHLYAFDLILEEALNVNNINVKGKVCNYSSEELNLIINECEKLHVFHGLGVCLNKKLHLLFHINYGRGQNTPEQFEEFTTRLKSGEFDLFLQENNLKLVI